MSLVVPDQKTDRQPLLVKILQPLLVVPTNSSLKLSPFGISDIIGHVTIGFVMYGFQYVVNLRTWEPTTAVQV